MSVTVSEQLPLLAAAPNGIKKLRELILELAVRGKLVAQDPNDERASELLKTIVAEKKRLVAEGKKPKLLEAISEEEKPFSIPDQWAWIRLGSCLEMINGRAFKPTDWKNSGLPIVRIQNLNRTDAPFNYCDENAVDDRHVIEPGRLLISWSGTPGTSFGAFIWEREKAALNQHIFSCSQIGNAFFDRFLKMAINTRLEELIAKAHGGVGLQHVTKGKLEALTLVLPPLAEQHRIVAKVDELMTLCDRLETQQADAESAHAQLVATLLGRLTQASDADDFAASWQRLSAHFHTLFTTESSVDALKQTLLQLAVMGKLVPQDSSDEPAIQLLNRIRAEKVRLVAQGELKAQKESPAIPGHDMPYELPAGWVWTRAEQISLVIVDCPHSTPKFIGSGHLCLDTNSFKQGRLIEHRLRYVDDTTFEARNARLAPKSGDLVFAREGIVGESLVIPDGVMCCLGQRVMLFRPARVNSDYLRLSISEPSALARMLALHKGIGAKHVNVADMRAALVPLPPLAEQHRIVAKVDQLMALCDQLSAVIQRRNQHSRHLADALVDKALSPVSRASVNVVDLSCYLVDRLVAKPTFGRTAHMKLIYLADTHLGFDFQGEYMREAAGPLDKNIYRVEKQAEANGWYTHTSTLLKSGVEKVTYHATDALATKAQQVAEALGDRRQELDRLIVLFGDKKTDDVQIIATLFAVWNDALLDGQSPSDDWIIREVRENWHVEKQRFTAEMLGHWLGWMRKHHLVPTGKPPRTQQQVKMFH